MRLSKEMLKSIIKEEIQKVLMNEAETAAPVQKYRKPDPGERQAQQDKRDAQAAKTSSESAYLYIQKDELAKLIDLEELSAEQMIQVYDAWTKLSEIDNEQERLVAALEKTGHTKQAEKLENQPQYTGSDPARNPLKVLSTKLYTLYMHDYHRKKAADRPTARLPAAAPAPQKQGMFGKMRSTFGFE